MDDAGQPGGKLFPAGKIPALVNMYDDDYYELFKPAQREKVVFERLKNNRIWDKLSDAERDWSLKSPFTRVSGELSFPTAFDLHATDARPPIGNRTILLTSLRRGST